jgi:hypothetical protein
MGGQPKSKASLLSSAEVRRWWEEPTEETGPTSGSVGILAARGGEDVKAIGLFTGNQRSSLTIAKGMGPQLETRAWCRCSVVPRIKSGWTWK